MQGEFVQHRWELPGRDSTKEIKAVKEGVLKLGMRNFKRCRQLSPEFHLRLAVPHVLRTHTVPRSPKGPHAWLTRE